jgi:alpha-2-macroglobulin
MMKTIHFLSRLCLVGLLAFSFVACKRTIVAKKMTKSMAAYIYAYSSGTIGREQPVRVRFTSQIVKPEDVGKSVDGGVFSMTPSVQGNAVWEDPQTIRFTPTGAFASGQTYLGAVRLKRLFKSVPSDAEEFQFDFRTRELYFDVITDGLQADASGDATHQDLVGEVTTSDRSDDKNVESVLTAKQKGKSMKINWVHAPDGQHHAFRIKEVERGTSASKVNLSWSGSSLGVSNKGESEVVIPAIGQFTAMSARLVQDAEQYIKVNFSDPLSTTGDLSGLLKINNWYGSLRTAVDGNSILVYPSDRVTGEHPLYVDGGIANSQGQKMGQSINFPLTFSDVKPQVRLVGRGVIMPSSEGLNFPFEAINLNFVDVEIVKIFNNNILQFLQTNDFEGENQMERVGRIVIQKRVALKDLNPSASTMKWTRYGVDLAQLVKKDPNAIYQVRIGFRRSYTNYTCTASGAKDDLNGMTVMQEPVDFAQPAEGSGNNEEGGYNEGDDNRSIWSYSWNGGEKTNGDDNYGGGESPCAAQYYNNNHFARRNVFASDLGIIAKRGADNSIFVAVSDLKSTFPRGSVKLDVYDYQQQILGTATTNSEGTAILSNIKGKAWVIVASVGDAKGYLPLSNQNALNLSRFDVAGAEMQKGLKGFLYGERGVWRPGDSLHLNFMLEDKEQKLPDDYPITLELYDPKGTLQLRQTSVENVKNIYPFNVATRADAPTGTWRADIKAGGATFTQPIKIETVKPNRLKIKLDFDKKEKEIAAGEEFIGGKLQVDWLMGTPARNVKARIEASMSAMKTEFPKYKDFVFDDPIRTSKGDPSVIFENNVDENGSAKINATLPKVQNAAGKMRVGLKIRAFEPSGDFSSDYQVLDYSPYKTYVGVGIPKNKMGEKRFDIGKKNNVSMVVVDKNGNPMRNRSVEVAVYRVEWRWWWETGGDDAAQFASAKDMKSILQQKVITDGNGMAEVGVTPDKWGRFFVHVTDPMSGHYSGDYFYSGYPWNDEEQGGLSRNNAAMLSFNPSKDKYAVGETVELNIPTPENGKALVSIENGSKVLESKWINTKNGSTTYSFKATAAMSPTVYAFVTLVQPHNTVKNDLPIRMYGVAAINIEDPKTHLEPIVKMPTEIKPEEKVTVEVREKSGRAMAYTISLVDDGLLDLTRFQTPDPWKTFYAREALGVQTFDIYDQVLGAYGGQLERVLNIGGDKAKKQRNAQKANRFKPVVMSYGPFYTSGSAQKHQILIPNYVGSVRAMVVATDGVAAYGSGEASAFVKKPLMVLATLPRVLTQKERLKLPVDVFAMSAGIKNATISVTETSGLVQVVGGSSKSVAFEKPTDKMVDFDLQVLEKVGVAKFKITADGGGEHATSEIEIDVRNPNPVITNIQQNIVQAGQSVVLPYNGIGTLGTNVATLEVSTIPPIDMAARLAYLLQYPYGCVEQTTSAAFPQLYVDKLMNLDDTKKKLASANIRAAIDRLRMFQTPDGGFGYWQGEETADAWATSYVGHFLLEAKAAGYALPPNMIERWTKAQQTAAKRWVATTSVAQNGQPVAPSDGWNEESRDLTQAYRLYTLAVAGSSESAAMNALREKKNLSVQSRWRLAAAYASSGKPEVAKQLIANLGTSVPKYRELGYTYGSELRDQAMILETLVLVQSQSQAIQVAQEVSQKLSSGDWFGTQSVAYGLMAMSKFAMGQGASTSFSMTYDINGKAGNFNSTTVLGVIDLPANGSNKVTIKNTSKTQLFVRLILRGQQAVGSTDPVVASNLNMNVQYKTLKGETVNPLSIKQGTDFFAEITIANPGTLGKTYKEMALSQIFPSGWEVLNPRMDRVPGWTNTSVPRYQDIRDDRVNTFFDLPVGKSHTYRIQLNAAYAGRFWLPTQLCEAMYDNTISAKQAGMWVDVVGGERKAM